MKKYNGKKLSGHEAAMLVAALLVVAALSVISVVSHSAEEKSVAAFHSIKGSVMVRADGEDDWTKAEPKMLLYENDVVKTEIGSNTVLWFEGGHLVKLGALVTMHITGAVESDKESKISLDLSKGKIFSRVQKMSGKTVDFSVKTPTAIAGVRGTEFSVNVSDDNTTTFALLSGKLEVSGDFQSYILEPNNMVTLVPGSESEAQVAETPDDVSSELEKEFGEMDVMDGEIETTREPEEVRNTDLPQEVGSDIESITGDSIVDEMLDNIVEQVIMEPDVIEEPDLELNDYPLFPPDR